MSIVYKSIFNTPIFNTTLIPFINSSLNDYDQEGLLRQIEMIAFKGTVFECVKHVSSDLMQVTTAIYPSSSPLYVDKRFLQETSSLDQEPPQSLLPANNVLSWIKDQQGVRYFWGGNCALGITEMQTFYPSSAVNPLDLMCQGLDCSGLLYEAARGLTPRNTADLIHYGQEIANDTSSLSVIKAAAQPLDLIVWKGHVLMILNREEVIESRGGKGVVISCLEERLFEIRADLKQKEIPFFIRRWHPDILS
ncbi:MAG: NlpC/P60 family protein [Candidatus Rhabdochlamydia sp.]